MPKIVHNSRLGLTIIAKYSLNSIKLIVILSILRFIVVIGAAKDSVLLLNRIEELSPSFEGVETTSGQKDKAVNALCIR